MGTLTINGRSITVDDSFAKLSPADQEKTVNEIAAKMGAMTPAPQAAPAPPAAPESIADQLSAGFTRGLDALPFGNKILEGAENAKAAVQNTVYGNKASPAYDPTYKAQTQQDVHASDAAQAERNPVASTVGTVTGAVAPFLVGGEIPAVAKILGMDSSVPLLARSLLSGGTNAALSGADALVRGASPGEAAKDAALSGTIGTLIPGAGELLSRGASALTKRVTPVIDALTNPETAAQKMVSGAAARDVQAGKAMTPADENAAAINGQPVINADRFGGGVRTLARTAGNSDPAAGEQLKDLTQDRFLTQNNRAVAFVKRITGGTTDDLALQDAIQSGARKSNDAAYTRAYNDPAASVVWTPKIKQLFQSPDFINAVKGAERTAANDAATTGQKAVKSPFTFDAQGNIGLRKNPNGSTALPSLQFWDIVQRNLRTNSQQAYKAGNNLLGSQLGDMRTQLLGSLDSTVPSFATARRGAAAAFGAEDALDAGRKFVGQPMGIPEAKAAYAKFTPAEQKAFGVGYASSLIDKINAAPDRVNVINQVFGSPASRAQVELALGKNAAGQLENFTRVEDIMQQTKQAVQGNSSTVKQLAAMGAIGGVGGGLVGGWDPRNVATGAGLMMAGKLGARALGKAVDQKVMAHVADILASNDPKAINRTILSATLNPQHSAAIKAIQLGLQAAAKGASTAITRPAPISITVDGGNALAPAF
jgi:hypothetical protein